MSDWMMDYAAKSAINAVVKRVVNGVPQRRINSRGGAGLFFGKFTYKPGFGANESKYDKTCCAEGTISDKDYIQKQSLLAHQCIFTMGDAKSDFNYMNGIRSKMIQRHGESGVTQVPLQAYSSGAVNKKFRMIWQKCEHSISNRNKHACVVEIYDLIAKEDMSCLPVVSVPTLGNFYPNHPIALMNYEALTEGTVGYSQATRFATQENVYDMDFKVERCQRLRALWGICNKTMVVLQPGEQYTHTTFHRKNFVFNKDKYAQDLNMETASFNGYIKGVSTMSLVCAKGRVGHITTAPNINDPTFDGVNLDYVGKYSTKIREELPYADKFSFEYGPSQWSGEGGARTILGVMEENQPTDTTGV